MRSIRSSGRSKTGRTLKRHERQDELDLIVEHTKSKECKKDLKTRQHLSERSFARSTRYGFKRARWRSLWRVEIQDYLIAAIQNIMVLVDHKKHKISESNEQKVRGEGLNKPVSQLMCYYESLLRCFFPAFRFCIPL